MDYNKIGEFISNERKTKKLTQAKLAEKLYVSDKTVSKWENGNGIPDTNIIPELCKILDCNINELLNGERIMEDKYVSKAEEKLLELQQSKEVVDKRLLTTEVFVGISGSLFFFVTIFGASFLEMATWIKILLIVSGCIVFFTAMFLALMIEQKAGFYQCPLCNHKYIPTYSQVCFSMHIGRMRFMKCPNCHKRSLNKKVVK